MITRTSTSLNLRPAIAGLLCILIAAFFVTLGAPPASAGKNRPGFEVPFPCGEVWQGQSRPAHGTGRNTHFPIDFNKGVGAFDRGMDVVSSADGVVVNSGRDTYNTVEVDHGNGWTTKYLHLEQQSVSIGDKVKMGDKVGTVGDVGSPGAFHLHYEQLLNGAPQHVFFGGDAVKYYFSGPGGDFRSGNDCNVPPKAQDVEFAVDGETVTVSGTVKDPNSPNASLVVELRSKWERGSDMERLVVEGKTGDDGEFTLDLPIADGGDHDLRVRARDAQTDQWKTLKNSDLDMGERFESQTHLTHAEVAEYLFRFDGESSTKNVSFPEHDHRRALNWMVEEGIGGVLGLNVLGDSVATRSSVAKYLADYAGGADAARGEPNYRDVEPEHAAYDAVEFLAARDVTAVGTDDEPAYFYPDKPITKLDLLTMLYRLDGSPVVASKEDESARQYRDLGLDSVAFTVASWADEAEVSEETFVRPSELSPLYEIQPIVLKNKPVPGTGRVEGSGCTCGDGQSPPGSGDLSGADSTVAPCRIHESPNLRTWCAPSQRS